MIRFLLVFALIFSPLGIYAQDGGTSAVEQYGPRRQISTIIYFGLAGAVLGLSTLSFYGRPQDYLTNIPIGFGVGVIVGTVYMTYKAASDPEDFYSGVPYQPNFQLREYRDTMASDLFVPPQRPDFSYRFSF